MRIYFPKAVAQTWTEDGAIQETTAEGVDVTFDPSLNAYVIPLDEKTALFVIRGKE